MSAHLQQDLYAEFYPEDMTGMRNTMPFESFGNHNTITFLTSMPNLLGHLEHMRILPISPVILDERLDMLGEDADLVRFFEKCFFEYSADYKEEFLPNCAKAMEEAKKISEKIVEAFAFFTEQRILIALLRRKISGLGLHEDFGDCRDFLPDGKYELIVKNQHQDYFGLERIHPYLKTLRHLLEDGQVIKAEKLVLKEQWNFLQDLGFNASLNLEGSILYVMKWQVLKQWLSRKPEKSLEVINHEINRVFEKTEIAI